MKASTVPCEAASKQPSGGMIWPPGNTSIRNRPPLISSTTFASRWAAPCSMSSDEVQAVDIPPLDFRLRDDVGTSTMAEAATAATAPPAFTMNRRRSLITLSLQSDELVVGAFRDVVPGADQRLELREGRVHLPGHGSLLGFFPDDLDG